MNWRELYEKYETALEVPFKKYGSLVVKYPWVILSVCVAFNCLLGLGLIRIKSETEAETLYTPDNSRASKDRATLDELYEDSSGSNFYPWTVTDESSYVQVLVRTKGDANILTTKYIDEIERIYNYVKDNVKVRNSTHALMFTDVCALQGSDCVVSGDVIISANFKAMVTANNISYPMFEEKSISGHFGNTKTSNGILTYSSVASLTFYLRQDSDIAYAIAEEYQNEFLEVMPTFSSSLVDIAYSTTNSLGKELENNVAGDIKYFAITIFMMLFYAGFATSGGDCVSERQNLGRAGVLATVLAILGSFGLVSAIGVKFVSVVGVMPFLVIGIGLDDMFILMSCLADCSRKVSIEDRIQKTVQTGGVAISITSITDFLAFAIGASSKFLGVRNFCIYTGVAVAFCYINQLTFFLPCMVINERRMMANRHCGTCRSIKSRTQLREEGHSSVFIFCCGGEPPTERRDNESPLEKYPKIVFKKLVTLLPFKIFVFVIFAVYLSVSIYGITNMEEGLLLSNLVTEESHYYSYRKWLETLFRTEFIVTIAITSAKTYSDASTQSLITNVLQTAKSNSYMNEDIEINWLSSYKSSGSYADTNEANFIAGLKTFLSSNSQFQNDVVLNDAETSIMSSRFYLTSNDVKTSTAQGKLMAQMRDVVDDSPLANIIAYSPLFIFAEQYVIILSNVLMTVGIAVAVMFVVTVIFMPHPLLVVSVTVTMLMILVGMFGFMFYWDLTLSSITMIHLIMSIGFSIDFSAHICHAYITADGKTREERVSNALTRTGGPIFNAAVSSIVGLISLLFSSSYIFQSFFKLMLLVILFGLCHSLFLIPVVFSFIGPTRTDVSGNSKDCKSPANDQSNSSQNVNKMDNLDAKEKEEQVSTITTETEVGEKQDTHF